MKSRQTWGNSGNCCEILKNENENDEIDTSDNLKRKREKIHQEERSIDSENNNQEGENDIKEKIIKNFLEEEG